ncbi:dihydroneopterin aldolase family protein [Halorussus halophilus]|uniref:dihydroneopterin aldolase family protein n=1 Tax=Halorussus halophilus TaxID=2650975 RepID=UPI00130182D6|nr:dihydroneopterin aldolase family protein [Halorussus halophilus]
MTSDSADSTTPTDGEEACFEAGIKFGALYHQFAGTPVSPDSAASLETAMEESIENQPFCESVTVDILEDKLAAEMTNSYTELTGRFMEVEIVVQREDTTVTTRMEMEDGYPLMQVESVESTASVE